MTRILLLGARRPDGPRCAARCADGALRGGGGRGGQPPGRWLFLAHVPFAFGLWYFCRRAGRVFFAAGRWPSPCLYVRKEACPACCAPPGCPLPCRLMFAAPARTSPVFQSANMSVGIAVLARAAQLAANVLGCGCDIEIIEKHHRGKQDAPSGTALQLARAVSEVIPRAFLFGTGACQRPPRAGNRHPFRAGRRYCGRARCAFLLR